MAMVVMVVMVVLLLALWLWLPVRPTSRRPRPSASPNGGCRHLACASCWPLLVRVLVLGFCLWPRVRPTRRAASHWASPAWLAGAGDIQVAGQVELRRDIPKTCGRAFDCQAMLAAPSPSTATPLDADKATQCCTIYHASLPCSTHAESACHRFERHWSAKFGMPPRPRSMGSVHKSLCHIHPNVFAASVSS